MFHNKRKCYTKVRPTGGTTASPPCLLRASRVVTRDVPLATKRITNLVEEEFSALLSLTVHHLHSHSTTVVRKRRAHYAGRTLADLLELREERARVALIDNHAQGSEELQGEVLAKKEDNSRTRHNRPRKTSQVREHCERFQQQDVFTLMK